MVAHLYSLHFVLIYIFYFLQSNLKDYLSGRLSYADYIEILDWRTQMDYCYWLIEVKLRKS